MNCAILLKESSSASFVTENYFSELGTQPAYGRLLDATIDAAKSAPPVAVISYGLFQQRFGADPATTAPAVASQKRSSGAFTLASWM